MNEMTIQCPCKPRPAGMDKAILRGAVADAMSKRTGKDLFDRTHGLILMAHSPVRMIKVSAERRGIIAA